MSAETKEEEEGEEHGVLLYYKYATIPDLPSLLDFYNRSCNSLGLLGRVRLAHDGVNVTVGGTLSSLEKHIAAVKLDRLFEGTDFKLAPCQYPLDDRIARECGFTSLSIRVVKELVTFSSLPVKKSPSISNAGKHLSAIEFHSVLQDAGKISESKGSNSDSRILLLDARNVYETRIGKFQTPSVETLDPVIRQYSDLPAWIDSHSEQLHGHRVLMYCTGGIRCEMASAYIRMKGAGYENVYQLSGGIQRYLEQFPDGGFFKGKNFVFDHRISVGSLDADIIGSCLLCGSSYDDYSSRCRCYHCRMLVLVCDNCQEGSAIYVCELCKNHDKGDMSKPFLENCTCQSRLPPDGSRDRGSGPAIFSDQTTNLLDLPNKHGSAPLKKLRILCLHGFRQNASNFKGRTASFAKKLKNIAEFVFVDAPHELPFVFQPQSAELNHDRKESLSQKANDLLHRNCRKRFAWLVATKSYNPEGSEWKIADEPFDPLQYQKQTDGWEESFTYLKTVFSQIGPFDGVLGFSQGAAIAARLCESIEQEKSNLTFRFAILCSGFALPGGELNKQLINLPSLHIFGNGEGNDRQISNHASMELAKLFDDGCSVVIEHDSGHIIPTRSPYIDRIKDFLQCFLRNKGDVAV